MKLDEFLRLNAPEDMAKVTTAISKACLMVWENVPFKAGLVGDINPSGDRQKDIDIFSNDVYSEALTSTDVVREVASEEMPEVVEGKGRLSVAMDPLDGSSNVESNNPLGSIFGFYSRPLPCSGRNIIGGLYVTYGNTVTITLSFGKGVHRFVAVKHGQEMSFELLGLDLRVPEKPEVYGVGGLRKDWIPSVRSFVDSLEERGMRMRYCGTFVGDYNQVLARGGIFAYPEMVGKPRGKLRILYEIAPMSFINEQGGGYATDGRRNVLDIEPKSLSETAPFYIGSAPLLHELERLVSSPSPA
ncbi:MAG TPA: class 1 fructose-bisphosphatase [Nitrososphaerales archaeon]|nr:class 1 fructose-bisphosphatase [Nitrososphaerales archaeon]